jgi:hypothetical protein
MDLPGGREIDHAVTKRDGADQRDHEKRHRKGKRDEIQPREVMKEEPPPDRRQDKRDQQDDSADIDKKF